MRYLLAILFILSASTVQAATFLWDRNSEADMKDYQLWMCFTPNCVVIKAPGMLQPGTIVQPPVGGIPQVTVDINGKEGAAAVSARDLTLNESVLSVQVPFDAKAPTGPANLRMQ